jgi:hypothetical protein
MVNSKILGKKTKKNIKIMMKSYGIYETKLRKLERGRNNGLNFPNLDRDLDT